MYDFSENTPGSLQAGVTISSRKFKKAADRNRVKRIMREAYRLQKLPLQQAVKEQNINLALFFIYTNKDLPAFDEVFEKMGIILQKLQIEILNLPLIT